MIKHNQVDECIGLKDLNNMPLFEFDIIEYAIEGDRDRMGCILWEHKKEQFIIKDLDDITLDIPFTFDGLVLFAPEDMKFRAHLFAQPDLMHALGVRDN